MVLLARSLIMPSEAVVVRAPEQAPSRIAGWNLKTYLPTYMASTSGTVVATTPHRNKLKPSCWSPATNLGPDVIPTTAMKMLRPTEFMNQTVELGMRPNE